ALSSRLYRLAGAAAELSGRRPADLCRSPRSRAPVGDRLSRRRAMDRERRSKGLVRADQVASVVPSAAQRMAGGRAGVADLCGPGFLTESAAPDLAGLKSALADEARKL